jgi:orotidine-5'-phosphate decarboxylase
MKSPIILALDTEEIEVAKKWISLTRDFVGIYKLGLEFFLKIGQKGVRAIQQESACEIFLDLKLHDIPNTVGAATAQVAPLTPKFLSVHATGGRAMIKAAAENALATNIAAVTILTSLGQEDLTEIGFEGTALKRSVALAQLAVDAGASAIVCSPLEIAQIRSVIPKDISIITPGIRPLGLTTVDDQKRVMDPKSAMMAGANFLVVGRPITSASNISDAAKAILDMALS